MWKYFCQYKAEVKDKPIFKAEQKRGNTFLPDDLSAFSKEDIKDITNPIVKLPIERPLTLEGFENWCADHGIIEDLSHYFSNYEERYSEYLAICSRIRRVIKQDQIEGGMAGIYNASITQRLNGLTENVNNTNTTVEQPLFGD